MSILDVDEATFAERVLDRSLEVPVVVDFWAAWCAPCRALSPVLEKLAVEADGSWVLAKVDVDANPSLASAARVQGIPSVRAFKDGRQVAEFTGALPEQQVRAWLARLGPSDADVAFEEGARAEEREDLPGAAEAYSRAVSLDPGHRMAAEALARVELEIRAGSLDRDELEERLERDPADVEALSALADLDVVEGRPEIAFERLLEVVRSQEGEARERARTHLLTLMATLPAADGRVLSARKRLALALY